MAEDLDTLRIPIDGDGGGLSTELRRIEAQFAGSFGRIRRESTTTATTMQRGFTTMLARIGPAIAGFLSLAALVRFGRAVVEEQIKAERALANLQAVLRATGQRAGLTAEEIVNLAEELERLTLFDGEDLKSAAAVLLTFKSVSKEVFGETLELAADVSAILGQDLQSSVLQLGKALEEPVRGITALRRAGISFTEAQQAQIKVLVESNRQLEAQRIILDTVARQVGGAARNQVTGLTGAVNNLSDAWSNFKKQVGAGETGDILAGAFNRLAEAIRWAGDQLERLSGFLNNLPMDIAGDIAQGRIQGLADEERQVRERIAQLEADIAAAGGGTGEGVAFEQLASARQEAEVLADRLRIARAELSSLATANASAPPMGLPPGLGGGQGSGEDDPVGGGAGSSRVSEFERAVERTHGQVEQLKKSLTEALFPDQATAMVAEFELLNAAIADGVKLTPELRDEIDRLVTDLAESTQRLEDARAADRIFNETRTAAEQYAATIEKLNGLLERGAIDQETFNRAVQQAEDALEDAGGAAAGVTDDFDTVFAGIQDGIADVILDFKNLEQSVTQVLASIARELVELGLGQLGVGLFGENGAGGLLDGLLKAFGLRARGGPVLSGDPYIVGEKEPEIFVPRVSGTIVPMSKLSGGMTYAPVFNIDARNATISRGEVEQIVRTAVGLSVNQVRSIQQRTASSRI